MAQVKLLKYSGSDHSLAQMIASDDITLSTFTAGSKVITDTIDGNAASGDVTVAGLNILNGKLNTNDSVVESNITNSAVTLNKIASNAVDQNKIVSTALNSSLVGGSGTQIGINLANSNIWTAAQYHEAQVVISGFAGEKFVITADAGDAASGSVNTKVFRINDSTGTAKAWIDEDGNGTFQDLTVNGTETVVGTLSGTSLDLTNNLSVSGDVKLGDTDGDSIYIYGKVNTDILFNNATHSIGDATNKVANIYSNTININNATVSGYIFDGTGTASLGTELSPFGEVHTGFLTAAGNVGLGSDSSDIINITGSINTSLIPFTSGTRDLGSETYKWRDLYLSGNVNAVGNVSATGNIVGGGSLTISGTTNLNGNINLGSDSGDTIVYNGLVGSSILFSATGFDIGSSGLPVQNFYSTTIYSNNGNFTGNLSATGNANIGGNVSATGNLSVSGNTTLGDTSGDTIIFNGLIGSDIIASASGYDLGSTGTRWNNLWVDFVNGVDANNLPDLTQPETITGAWTFNNIDLNLGFKIGGVATSSGSVTAGNLNILTAGSLSNADSLHTHTGVAASDLKVLLVASGAVNAGAPVYICGANSVAMADADSIGTGKVVGIAEESIDDVASGYITISGFATISGASFTIGEPVFLSQTVGLLTSSEPSGAGTVIYEIGIAVSSEKIIIAPKAPIINS